MRGGSRQRLEKWNSISILDLHAGEIQWRRRLTAEHLGHEAFLFFHQVQSGIESAFIAHRRLGNCTKGFSTGASCTMCRQHLEEIGQLEKATCGSRQVSCGVFLHAFDARSCFQKIRPAKISHEHEIATQDPDWFVRSTTEVGDQIAEVLRGVPRSVHGGEFDATNVELVSVGEFRVGHSIKPACVPILAALTRNEDMCGFNRGKLSRTRKEIRMDVGLGHRGDLQFMG